MMATFMLDGRMVRSDDISDVFVGERMEQALAAIRQVELAKIALRRKDARADAGRAVRRTARDF